jgi:hypothetical protein
MDDMIRLRLYAYYKIAVSTSTISMYPYVGINMNGYFFKSPVLQNCPTFFTKHNIDLFEPNANLDGTAQSQTPRPIYRWNAETVSFPMVYGSGGGLAGHFLN